MYKILKKTKEPKKEMQANAKNRNTKYNGILV